MVGKRGLVFGLAIALMAVGCQIKVDVPTVPTGSAKPDKSPGPKATPTGSAKPDADPEEEPTAKQVGAVRGKVFGRQGRLEGVVGATVEAGGVRTISADPQQDQVKEERATNREADNLSVMHAFADDLQPELALRVRRVMPPTDTEADRYVYLRPGEFLLEGLKPGNHTLKATRDGVSGTTDIVVFARRTVEDVTVRIEGAGTPTTAPTGTPTGVPSAVPTSGMPPSANPLPRDPNGKVPKIVEWAKLEPINGLSISVVERRETDANGIPFTSTTITYRPDPPDVTVTLKAPPGSPGTIISAYEVSYEYTTPNQQRAGKPPIVVGPILVPTPPITVPAAEEIAFGAPVLIKIPLGSRTLNEVFAGGKDNQPGLVIANIEFKDDKGVPVPNKDLNTLKVSVPLRAL